MAIHLSIAVSTTAIAVRIFGLVNGNFHFKTMTFKEWNHAFPITNPGKDDNRGTGRQAF